MKKGRVMKRLSVLLVIIGWHCHIVGVESALIDIAPQEHIVSHQTTEPSIAYRANLALEAIKQPTIKVNHTNLEQQHSEQVKQAVVDHAQKNGLEVFQDDQLFVKPVDTQIMINELYKLPKNSLPKDIPAALIRMNQGEIFENAILVGDVTQIKNSVAQTNLDQNTQKTLVSLLVGKDTQGFIIAADRIGVILSKNNPAQFKQVRDAYLNLLVDMQWGLFKKSLMQQEGFASGAITVIDPQGNVMRSMENYVKFVNPKFNAPGLSWSALTHDQAYSRSGRASSHWKGQVVDNRIYGINVKFDGNYTQSLPANKDQLNFAQLTNGRVFVKWEYYGTTLTLQDPSAVNHVVNYVKDSIGRKKSAQRTEATMPKDITINFNNILQQAHIKLNTQQARIVQQQGIAGMRNILQSKAPHFLANFDTFLTTQKGYNATTLQYRKADEVIVQSQTSRV